MVEAPEETVEPSGGDESGESGPLRQTSEGPPETAEEKTEAEAEEAEEAESESEEEPLESPPAAPETHPTLGEAGTGMPEPQLTTSSYEVAKTAISDAESQASGRALIDVAVPTVRDAEGRTVPVALSVTENTITLTIKAGTEVTYPVLNRRVANRRSEDKASEARSTVKYGLSDPLPEKAGHIDEQIAEAGKPAPGVDPTLKKGPLKIKTARLVIPYDVVSATTKYAKDKDKYLKEWLKKVGKEHLQPLVTISKDYERDPCGEKRNSRCLPPPPVSTYKKSVERLIKDFVSGNKQYGYPRPVEL